MSLLDTLLSLSNQREISARSSPKSPTSPAATSGDSISETLALLDRLKAFTLPAGRMLVAREIASRCSERLAWWNDPESKGGIGDITTDLAALHDIERDLLALGAVHDAELAKAIGGHAYVPRCAFGRAPQIACAMMQSHFPIVSLPAPVGESSRRQRK
jgi:hypothetical protein